MGRFVQAGTQLTATLWTSDLDAKLDLVLHDGRPWHKG